MNVYAERTINNVLNKRILSLQIWLTQQVILLRHNMVYKTTFKTRDLWPTSLFSSFCFEVSPTVNLIFPWLSLFLVCLLFFYWKRFFILIVYLKNIVFSNMKQCGFRPARQFMKSKSLLGVHLLYTNEREFFLHLLGQFYWSNHIVNKVK